MEIFFFFPRANNPTAMSLARDGSRHLVGMHPVNPIINSSRRDVHFQHIPNTPRYAIKVREVLV